MEITIRKNVKINVKMYSNSDLFDIEEFNCEVNQNILTVTSKIYVATSQTNFKLLFEVKSNIDLDQIDESTYIDLPIDDYKFLSSTVNPNNLEDVDKIIAESCDSSILSIEESELLDFIIKDPSILDNLILLIDKANKDNKKYDKNDVDSVVNAFYDIVNDEHDYIDAGFYDNMKDIDPVIANKVMTSLQKIVQEEWNPYIGDGLDDELEDNVSIYVEF